MAVEGTTGTISTPLYDDKKFREKVKLNRILQTMLDFAHDCGKGNGKRYVACAICACSVGDRKNDHNNADQNAIKLQNLHDVMAF